MEERLQKLLAQAGLCSRREAERWIDDGRVTVNGRTASVGDKADPRRDKILVDSKSARRCRGKGYLMLYKPRGYVTTMTSAAARRLRIWYAAAVRASCRSAAWTTTPRACCC